MLDTPLRVLLADDHELARAGLRAMLGGLPALQVVAEAENGIDAIAMTRRLQPDLLLLDLRMPGADGFHVIRHLVEHPPTPCMVVVTMHDSFEYLREAKSAGAHGYVLKDSSRADLLGAIEIALHSWRMSSTQIAKASPVIFASEERLTERETQVLSLVAHGLTNRQIGIRLGIASGTAKIHVERILAKLGVCDRTQAAVRAAALSLVRLPPR